MKRTLLFLFVLIFSVCSIFAQKGIVTWFWFENDPQVEYYRYQVDGELEDGWTVVDWAVNEVSIELEVSVPHILYLQQSYDGENWSASSLTESDVFTEEEAEPEPVVEEEFVEEEVFEDVIEEDNFFEEEFETVVEEKKVEEVTEQKPEIIRPKKRKMLDVGIGYSNSIPNPASSKMLGGFISYTQYLKDVKLDISVALKLNIGGFVDSSIIDVVKTKELRKGSGYSYVNTLAVLTAKVNNCDIYAGLGPDFSFAYNKGKTFRLGLAAEVGVRYFASKNLTLGFALTDHYYLLHYKNMLNRFDSKIYITKSF